ncbi:MAG: putative amidohydrolase/ribosomal protein S18 acetylase RimI-like enzyme [Planctomycetota bacterium]|jgi:predicted amidohydrolase/ribosomal protein S18 acetylase RimI-like enzyme
MTPIPLEEFETQIEVRPLKPADFDEIVAMQLMCFPDMPTWTKKHVESQISHFSEGQIGIFYDGRLVASSCSLILDYDLCSEWHDWKAVADGGFITNHDPDGDVLYGIEIMVHPEFRSMRLARRLYTERKRLARERNLEAIVIGGRIPGYAAHKDEMTAHEYAKKVADKTLYDPVLTTQLANGFELKQLIPDYLPSDEDSVGWASHMEWINVDYRSHQKREIRPVQMVRLATVQYQMRAITSWEEFEQQVVYFVDTAGDYRCDFVTFPELFTTQLLSLVTAKRPSMAARELASFNERYIELFQSLAVRFHVNIIGGSNFAIENDKLYNISYLFRRDGTIGKQYKIHVTPAEWRWWGVTGGDKVEVFDTDCGRIAILICYDIEFPELARIATKKGAQVIFVPFNTDERSGYLRVRICAMARCIENHVYTVLSGCTGNLPQVRNADIHYAQSGIYTPSDLPFSPDATAAECTPNIETIVMKDLDIELLRRHRYQGTTQNWRDRRRDLYRVRYREDGKDAEV